jgi:hypothetical protein
MLNTTKVLLPAFQTFPRTGSIEAAHLAHLTSRQDSVHALLPSSIGSPVAKKPLFTSLASNFLCPTHAQALPRPIEFDIRSCM